MFDLQEFLKEQVRAKAELFGTDNLEFVMTSSIFVAIAKTLDVEHGKSGRFLVLDESKYPVSLDDELPMIDREDGTYLTDIYIIPVEEGQHAI